MTATDNGIDFVRHDEYVTVLVERECAPFDEYLCGWILEGEDGFFRFHPANGDAMWCKLLREIAEELSRLNTNSEQRG